MLRAFVLFGGIVAALTAAPAAAGLPPPVRAMLDAAIASGDESDIASIAKLARLTNPQDIAEIDAIVAAYRAKISAQRAETVETEAPNEASLFRGWHGSGELGAFITTGNTSSIGVSGSLTLKREGMQWRQTFRAAADYQRTGGMTTRNQQLASYEPNYKFSPHLYVYGLAMYEQDRFQGFHNRVTLSGGLGYRVIDEMPMTLDIKGGPSWRYTDWLDDRPTGQTEGFAAADFVWRISPLLTFSDGAQALWGSGNSTYSNLASLTAKFSRALSGRLSYTWRHETDPPPGIGKDDTITRATIVYSF